MPLYIEKDKIIVISPPHWMLSKKTRYGSLYFMRFKKMGLKAVALNEETYNEKLHKVNTAFKIKETRCKGIGEMRRYGIIVTSLNMCLKHDKFRQLLSLSNESSLPTQQTDSDFLSITWILKNVSAYLINYHIRRFIQYADTFLRICNPQNPKPKNTVCHATKAQLSI